MIKEKEAVVVQFSSPGYRDGRWCDLDVAAALFDGLPYRSRRGVQGDLYRHLSGLYRDGAAPDVARACISEIEKRGRHPERRYRVVRRTTIVREVEL
jgi:hypothetical protein